MDEAQHAAAIEQVARGPAAVAVLLPDREVGIEHDRVGDVELLDCRARHLGVAPNEYAGECTPITRSAELAVARVPLADVRQRPVRVDPGAVEELDQDRAADLLRHAQECNADPLEPCGNSGAYASLSTGSLTAAGDYSAGARG